MEAIEAARIRHEARPLQLEDLPNALLAQFGMPMGIRIQVPLKKAEARSWASKTLSWVSRG